MFRRRCPHCRQTGLVRGERVIKAGKAESEFTCNGCGHVWRERDPRPDSPPPKRSKQS